MLVEADHALVLIVVPKNFDSLPLEEIYTARGKGYWVFSIVEKSLEGRFHQVYGDLPWDEVWVVDLNDGLALEKVLAEVRVRAEERKPKPVIPPPPSRDWVPPREPAPWPSPPPRKKHWVEPRWQRTHSDLSDESLKKVQRSIRRMARSAF